MNKADSLREGLAIQSVGRAGPSEIFDRQRFVQTSIAGLGEHETLPAGGFRANEIIETGKRIPFQYTIENGPTFTFKLVKVTEIFEGKECTYFQPHIVDSPDYGSRNRNDHFTHIMYLRPSKAPMVCRGNYREEFQTQEGAEFWCRMWAIATWKYVESGQRFPGDEGLHDGPKIQPGTWATASSEN